ncbi:TerD family protein [Streptomyces sp. NPDC101132]|uniref:TerD family protein n=1 Tax=Streptomyces sp. NPDC101132 TaxID=3366110 RepID=UPI003803DAD4
MAREFQRGHKAKISDLTAGTDLYVGVQISGPGLTFDISCFGLDADERLSDDRYFVFFNQPKSPEEAIQQLGPQAGDTESFRVTLDRIPASIHKLSFTATIDGAGQMSQVGPGYIRVVAGGEEVVRYAFTGAEFSTERAVMLGDFYLKDVWRFAAVGQGFDGGLAALLQNFGGEVAEEPEAQPAAPAPVPGFAPPPAPAAPVAPAPVPAPAPAFGTPTPQTAGFGAPPAPPAPVAPFTPAAPPAPAAPVAPTAPPAPAAPFGAPSAPPAAVPAPFAPAAPPATTPPGYPAATTPPGYPGTTPPGTPPPGIPGQPFGGQQLAPVPPEAGLRVVLTKYAEAAAGDRWTEQNPQQVRATLAKGHAILAKQGSMVAYQGDIDFAHKGSGLLGKLTGQLTGQGMSLMRCSGEGEVFLADEASRVFVIRLEGEQIYTSAHGVLAFDENLDTEVRRIEGAGLPGGGFFAMAFSGTGAVVVKTRGTPVVLPVGQATYVDGNAVIAWSAGAQAVTTTALRLRRSGYASAQSEAVNLQFRGAPGNFVVVQPFEA